VAAYRRFVHDGIDQTGPWTQFKDQVFLGSEAFVDLFRQTLPPDRDLSMDMAFESLRDLYPDEANLLGVIRDIDRVVVVMQAATSKNRTDPIVRRQLLTRGIRV
jgi:hypothetical protein